MQMFIEKNIDNLIELRNSEEIVNFAKKNGLSLSLSELRNMKEIVEQSINLAINESKVLSLNSLKEVAGGADDSRKKTEDLIISTSKGVTTVVSIGCGIAAIANPACMGACFLISSAASILGNYGEAYGEGMKTTDQKNEQYEEQAGYLLQGYSTDN